LEKPAMASPSSSPERSRSGAMTATAEPAASSRTGLARSWGKSRS
jgi:hypothetical protein